MIDILVKAVTGISVIASFASILGAVHLYRSIEARAWRIAYRVAAIGVIILAGAVMFAPLPGAESIEANVRAKLLSPPAIAYYVPTKEFDPDSMVLILRGDVRIAPGGEVDIEFPLPFYEPPEPVEFRDPTGKTGAPSEVHTTAHGVRAHWTSHSNSGTLRWIARGRPLFPIEVTKVKEGILLGPRGGGPPPGDGFESAPIKEICDAIARGLENRQGDKK